MRNDGLASFEDVTALAGRVGNGHTIAAKFFDLDHDGWLDLLLSEFDATPNLLYTNRGGLGFVEQAAALGADVGGSTHVIGPIDVNGDGWFDLSVGNDWPVSYSAGFLDVLGEILLLGQPDGTYLDVTAGSGHEANLETMGIAWGDVDYDGDPDSFRTEVGDQVLFVNQGWPQGMPWTWEAHTYGIAAGTMTSSGSPGVGDTIGWGCVLTDLDFDPWLDLFFVCGNVCPTGIQNQHNFLFIGDGPGAGFTFSDRTQAFGLYDEVDDRALVASDIDADGDVDLLIGAPGGTLRAFENRVDPAGQGWLSVLPVTATSAPGGRGHRGDLDRRPGLPPHALGRMRRRDRFPARAAGPLRPGGRAGGGPGGGLSLRHDPQPPGHPGQHGGGGRGAAAVPAGAPGVGRSGHDGPGPAPRRGPLHRDRQRAPLQRLAPGPRCDHGRRLGPRRPRASPWARVPR